MTTKSSAKPKKATFRNARATWTQEAQVSNRTRHHYRSIMAAGPSSSPLGELDSLSQLLTVACDHAMELRPSIAYEIRQRATSIFESILDATVPRTREHAKFPLDPAVVTSLVHEARFALHPLTVIGETRMSVRDGKYVTERAALIELWARKNAPLNAGESEIAAVVKKCRKYVEMMGPKSAKVSDAHELVAALFDSTPAMVKKARGRRGARI